jgi:integrase
MNISPQNSIPDQDVFAGTRPPTLATILQRVEAELTGKVLRDTRSAFRVLMEQAGLELETEPATPDRVRELLGDLSASALNIRKKRLANIRSLVRKAVERFGPKRIWITREIELAPAWKTMLDSIPDRQHSWGLSRLACFCTVKGIAPEEVSSEILIGFQTALEAESLSKDPANIRKHSTAIWNMCAKNVPGWPRTKLASPFKKEAYMLPFDEFPQGFRDDAATWQNRCSTADPTDFDALVRELRPDTLKSYRYSFRRLASALVREHGMDPAAISGLDVLCEIKNLQNALRCYLPKHGYSPEYASKMASQMRSVARHLLRLPEAQLDEIDLLVRRIKPPAGGMKKRNRQRLKQFDDEETVRRLLNFPAEEHARAVAKKNPLRRAKGVERALAISLLIFTGLRVKNLRSLRLDTQIRRSGKRVFIDLDATDMKTHTELELELPLETIELLDLFVSEFRKLLPGSDSVFLFPSPDGGPRSYSAMREAISGPLKKHAGIEISPHQFRHLVAKIIIRYRPDSLHDVSRWLGHAGINTTYKAYLGTETPEASRRINQLLEELRNDEISPAAARKKMRNGRIRK